MFASLVECAEIAPPHENRARAGASATCPGLYVLDKGSTVLRLIPDLWGGFPIITRQQFEVQDVNHAIIVQVSLRGGCGIVAHPDRQGIELIDHIITIDIAGQQADRGHCCRVPDRDCGRALAVEETTGCSNDGVVPGREWNAEYSFRSRGSGTYLCVIHIVYIDDHRFAR